MATVVTGGKKGQKDQYANSAFGLVTMSAANTLTFAQIMMGTGLFEGRALCLHRIKYNLTNISMREIAANTDTVSMAITTSNRLTALTDVSDPAIIDRKHIIGMGANVEPWTMPLISDFTSLPMGGRLVPANPLWVGLGTAGAVAASVCRVELEFTFIELSSSDYLELLQSLYPANIA